MKQTKKRTDRIPAPRFSLGHLPSCADAPETPQACAERAALVHETRGRLRELARALPWLLLPKAERNAIGGVNFQGAPSFVVTLCTSILEHPERYPDLQERARFLLGRLRESEGWAGLREELRGLAELAGDHMLVAREESINGAIAIVQKLEGAASLEAWGGGAWERLMGVMAARVVLLAHRQTASRRQAARRAPKDTTAHAQRRRRWEARIVQAFGRLLARQGQK
jgi:hypothetical protein